MRYYWEHNLIKNTNKKSESGLEQIIFVPNLKLFILNNKDRYDLDLQNSFAINPNEQSGVRCIEVSSKDGTTIWRQIDGCET